MVMSNNVSHLWVKLLCNGFAARVSATPRCGPRLWFAAECFGKCKSSIVRGFSQDSRADVADVGGTLVVVKRR